MLTGTSWSPEAVLHPSLPPTTGLSKSVGHRIIPNSDQIPSEVSCFGKDRTICFGITMEIIRPRIAVMPTIVGVGTYCDDTIVGCILLLE